MVDTMIRNAVATGELVELLTGQLGYAIANPYLETPTEPMQVFRRYVAEFGRDPVKMQAFGDAVVKVSQDLVYSWFSVYYLMDILESPAMFGQAFDLQELARQVLGNVKKQKEALLQLRRWAGARDPAGCWGVADRMAQQVKRYCETPEIVIDW